MHTDKTQIFMNVIGASEAEGDFLYKELSEKMLECAFKVQSALGRGFLEKVYENALVLELRKQNLECAPQAPIKVFYEGESVGEYFADILLEGKIILEIKCAESLVSVHTAQLLNYLKASGIKVGYILNFARPKLEYKRLRS